MKSEERNKVDSFVSKLWNNPMLSGLSPLQKEEQLNLFLQVNESKLSNSFQSENFFPDRSWHETRELIQQSITDCANKSLWPMMRSVLENNLDLSFISRMESANSVTTRLQKSMSDFVERLIVDSKAHRELASPFNCLSLSLVEKYMHRAFKIRKYINFEFCRLGKQDVNYEDIINSIKSAMLIRPAIYMFGNSAQGLISPSFSRQVIKKTADILNGFPENHVQDAIESALPFQDNPHMASVSRMVAIFSHRCRNMKSNEKVHRGAESSDKSWFSIARKNYKFHGFDLDMLVELHSIATNNGW